jgi:hypothetical protein
MATFQKILEHPTHVHSNYRGSQTYVWFRSPRRLFIMRMLESPQGLPDFSPDYLRNFQIVDFEDVK